MENIFNFIYYKRYPYIKWEKHSPCSPLLPKGAIFSNLI